MMHPLTQTQNGPDRGEHGDVVFAGPNVLTGRIRLPGYAGPTLVALALAAFSRGVSTVEGAAQNSDIDAFRLMLGELGIRAERDNNAIMVTGPGPRLLLAPVVDIDSRGSLPAFVMALSLVGGLSMRVRFTGLKAMPDELFARLRHRVECVGGSLEHKAGGVVISEGPAIALPATDERAVFDDFERALTLMLALSGPAVSRIPAVEPEPLNYLYKAFGVDIGYTQPTRRQPGSIRVAGLPQAKAARVTMPTDPVIAAAVALYALAVPGSELTIENVLVTPERSMLLDTLLSMGANLDFINQRPIGPDQVADLFVRSAPLYAITLTPEDLERVAPTRSARSILAVAAGLADRESRLEGLTVEEATTFARLLDRLGLWTRAEGTTLRIRGHRRPTGGAVTLDHAEDLLAFGAFASATRKAQLRMRVPALSATVAVLADLKQLGLAAELLIPGFDNKPSQEAS
jgi:3-phosphoshikimate 1-carboxyvinyltransferase